jgi:integrase
MKRPKGYVERSPGRYAIIVEMRDPVTGKRKRKWHSFRGTVQEVKAERAKLVAAVATGDYIEPSKTTVADFVRARIGQWEASGEISPRTAQRYRQLLDNQIVPHLGTKMLRKLKPLDIEAWHTCLRDTVQPRTVGHAHRVLGKAFKDAAKNDIVSRNVCKDQPAPKVEDDERVIVRDVAALLTKLKDWRHAPVAMVALFTGMRLGEVLALRWNNVDLDAKVIRVREALEQTAAFGVRFKPPKSKAGRRDITLPDVLVEALREHRKAQLELRLQLGAGKLPDDAPVHYPRWAAIGAQSALDAVAQLRPQRWYAGRDVPRPAPHPCQSANRPGRGHRHHQQAPRPRQARHHAAHLRPHVPKGRQQGGASDQFNAVVNAVKAKEN